MIAAVFDTNVLVSGVLSPSGAPGRLLDAILDGFCQPVVSDSILAEYEEVLGRPKFGLPLSRVRSLLDGIRARSLAAPFHPVTRACDLPDPDDVSFLEAAAALHVPMVAGNTRHFPKSAVGRISVLTPAAFLGMLRE
jgi:uncharacterized protein